MTGQTGSAAGSGSTGMINFSTNAAGTLGATASLFYDTSNNHFELLGTNPALCLFPTTTEPTPEIGNELVIYNKTVAGGSFLKAMNSAGEDTLYQGNLGQDKIVWSTAIGNATTVPQQWGIPAWTAVGTATARNWASTNLLTRQKRLGYVSVATAGGISQLYLGAAQWSIGNAAGLGGFFGVFRFGVSDAATVSGARMFIGMTSSIAALTNVEPTTLLNCIGVAQISTSANLQIVYGGSAAQTAIDLGVNFPANTLSADSYELILYSPSNVNNVCGYKVSRLGTAYIAEGTITAATPGTQLPLTTTALAPRFFRTNNLTALSIGLDFVSMYLHSDY